MLLKLSNRLIDFFTGYDIQSELEKILKTDQWTRESIENDQKKKFKKLKDFACKSEYYKNYENKELSEFPIMERNEFKKQHEFLKTNQRKSFLIQHSSGSTSTPLTLYISKEMLLAKRVSHQKLLRWNGLTRDSYEFKIGGVKINLASKLYYYLKGKRYVNSFEIKDHPSIIKKYNRFKPDVLYGYPSAIYNLILQSEKAGSSLYEPCLVITHAETLTTEIKEKFISTFPHAKVLNQYWSTEANIAETCPHGNLHVDEDTLICELINMNTEGVGDLLITNLYSYDLPIIRYKIGDRVKFAENECSCGRKTKVIERVEGREIDYLNLPDGRSIPVTAFYFSRYAENIMEYQLVYHENKGLIEFRYTTQNENDKIDELNISSYLQKDYGLTTQFVKVDKIQLSKGGKYRKLLLVG